LTRPDAAALARLHAAAFAGSERAWTVVELASLLEAPGVLVAITGADGFALARTAADEAELLTLAVAPNSRGRGLGAYLLGRIETQAAAQDATRIFLEVHAGNAPALRLYSSAGYRQIGRRRDYYAPGRDALVLSKELCP
jgi:ribosomal-protein-alanine N-acetyltransferase